jgi:hypothetical protein
MPPGAELLASSERTGIEMYSVGEHALAIQGHPEFFDDVVLDLLNNRLSEMMKVNTQHFVYQSLSFYTWLVVPWKNMNDNLMNISQVIVVLICKGIMRFVEKSHDVPVCMSVLSTCSLMFCLRMPSNQISLNRRMISKRQRHH